MTLADDLDEIAAMVSDQASPDEVGRMVLIAIAKNSMGRAGHSARHLCVGGCGQHVACPAPLSETKFEPTPKTQVIQRGRVRLTPAGSK